MYMRVCARCMCDICMHLQSSTQKNSPHRSSVLPGLIGRRRADEFVGLPHVVAHPAAAFRLTEDLGGGQGMTLGHHRPSKEPLLNHYDHEPSANYQLTIK